MPCTQCEGIEELFDVKKARSQLRKFRRKGPDHTTRMLIEDLLASVRSRDGGRSAKLLLDIGAGVGAIHHTLLDSGVQRAVHVDASSAYLAVAREEADRRGHARQVEFVAGDFVAVSDALPPADIVTLDRVICCYPEMSELVARSAAKARIFYGAVYPRERALVRLSIAATNLFFRLRRSLFRTFLHSPRDIEAVLGTAGLVRHSVRRTLLWEVAVFARTAAP